MAGSVVEALGRESAPSPSRLAAAAHVAIGVVVVVAFVGRCVWRGLR